MSAPAPVGRPPRPGPAPRVVVPLPRLSPPVRRFLATESGGALLLLTASVAALVWANVPSGGYAKFWSMPAAISVGDWGIDLDLQHWINDAGMAVFFMVVGLEISREVTVGELRSFKAVIVPVLGAVGGLAVPIAIYFAFNPDGAAAAGWGIPMSTDTAFLIGVLALFGPRCPDRLRLFLLTLAIADDIGAIVLMGVFYADDTSVMALIASAVLLGVLAFLRWSRVWRLTPYMVVGLALWVAVYESGVHPTLAGVAVGLLIPAARVGHEQRDRLTYYGQALKERALPDRARLAVSAVRATVPANDRLQDALHPVSAYVVIPAFGLANAGVLLSADSLRAASGSPVTYGVIAGLVVGNAVGITAGAAVALRTGLGVLPGLVRYGHVLGGAFLAGIGFTISLFITGLAFDDEALRNEAKIGILVGSLLAAVAGSLVLRYFGEKLPMCTVDEDEGVPALPPTPWRPPAPR